MIFKGVAIGNCALQTLPEERSFMVTHWGSLFLNGSFTRSTHSSGWLAVLKGMHFQWFFFMIPTNVPCKVRACAIAHVLKRSRAQLKSVAHKKKLGKKSHPVQITQTRRQAASLLCVCVCVCVCVGCATSSILDSVLTSHNNKQLSETRVPQAHRLGS